MHKKNSFVSSIVILLILATSSLAQSKKDKPAPQGTPIFWQEPVDIGSRDLLNGPGGESMKPDLSRVTFVEHQSGGGFSTKYRVRDGSGRIWIAKLGKEAQPETAAVRLLWALGYPTEINYLVPCVKIEGAPQSNKPQCEGNGFANVKFEARPEERKRLEIWSWASNPFIGTNEYKGLIILMSLINNWDLKDDNNKIVWIPGDGTKSAELHYIISDLGATFGKTGGFVSRNRNEPESFAKSKFIEKVEGDQVKFAYGGKNSKLFENITVSDTTWIAGWLTQLSDKQISDAFRAANYTQEEVELLTKAVRSRISQLPLKKEGTTGGGNQ